MTILTGKNADPSARWRGASKANYYVPALGCLGGIPFFVICLYSSNFYVALLLGLLGEYFLAECWFGPYMAAMQVGLAGVIRMEGTIDTKSYFYARTIILVLHSSLYLEVKIFRYDFPLQFSLTLFLRLSCHSYIPFCTLLLVYFFWDRLACRPRCVA